MKQTTQDKLNALNMLQRIEKRVRNDWSRSPQEIWDILCILAMVNSLLHADDYAFACDYGAE